GLAAERWSIAMVDLYRDRHAAGCCGAGRVTAGHEHIAGAHWPPRRSTPARRRSRVMTHGAPPAIIRRARVEDAPTLAGLGAATFTETFGHLYPPEDLQAFLVGAHSVDAWTRALGRRAVWLAVLADSTPVGFIAVGDCKLPIENREPAAGEIQQLYVLARHHNLRLGSQLMDVGLAWLESH